LLSDLSLRHTLWNSTLAADENPAPPVGLLRSIPGMVILLGNPTDFATLSGFCLANRVHSMWEMADQNPGILSAMSIPANNL